MHTTIVTLLTMILPLTFAATAWLAGTPPADAIGRWFAFWAVGMRLGTAGLSQVLHPRFTSETIFAVTDPRARPMVRELGFGNLALGTLGLASLAFPSWVVPAAIAGAVFYGLAGAGHLMARERNASRNLAMVSDLVVAGALVVAVVAMAVD